MSSVFPCVNLLFITFFMNTTDPLIAERIRKVQEIRHLGIDPYTRSKFSVSCHSIDAIEKGEKNGVRDIQEIQRSTEGDSQKYSLRLAGRLVLFRSMGKLAFGHIQDMKGRIQICFQRDMFEVEGLNTEEKTPMKFIEKLVDLGDFLGVEGELFKTNHGEITVFVKKCRFLSKSLRPMPEKFHGVSDKETLYRERNLDLMTNQETMDRFELRSNMLEEIRAFFKEKDFLEVETSMLQGQAGGAMAKVFETHHNALDHDFSLRIALELDLKRAIGGGMERVFEIGKNFRNEGIDPSHLQEFTMLEWYAVYEDIEENKKWTEELFHRLTEKVFKKTVIMVVDTEGNETEIDFGKKFDEKRFPDLIKEYTGLDMVSASMEEIQSVAKGLGIETEGIGRGNLLDDIYKKTARPNLIQPTFVYDYPEELKPLATPNGDGTASCFQLVINSWEIVNSYGELIDPQVQRRLLEEQAQAKSDGDEEAMEVDEVFLKAMEHGFPPMTGSGFGIDRLTAIFTGQPNLRDVVLFPTVKPEQKKEKNASYKSVVIVLNKESNLAPWQQLNTVAHLSTAFGARKQDSKELFHYDHITTQDNEKISMNIQHAVVIKTADSGSEIKTILDSAKTQGLEISEFTREMLETSDDNIVKQNTKSKVFSEVEHLGVLLFGEKKVIDTLTKPYPLFA